MFLMGKYYVEKSEELFEICENYNSGADDYDFELDCYQDKTLRFNRYWGINIDHPNYKDFLKQCLLDTTKITSDRMFDMCSNYAD